MIFIILHIIQIPLLSPGDIVIDGGNSEYRDSNVSQLCCSKQNLSYIATYLKLPWIGNVSLKFEDQISTAITSCFHVREVFNTRVMLPSARKDTIPTTKNVA